LPLFTLALRSWFLLVVQFRVFLKYQLQHFLRTFLALFSSGSFSLGHQEVALDTLKQLLRADFFEVELFVNFDCDLYSANVLSDILCFLSRVCLLCFKN
jgi:brefeldin A-resistance guanine nucleotide exchange factor 1